MITNRQIVDGVKNALFKAFKVWLDENRAEILKIMAEAGAAANKGQKKQELEPPPAQQPHFLTTAQLAERWHYHPEYVRHLLRRGIMPLVRLGRKVRVTLQEVERYEREATSSRRL